MYNNVFIGLKFADDYTRPFFPACLKSAIMRQQQSQWKMYALIVHILIVVAKSVITIITSKKFMQQALNSLAI